jgi:surfeit locus 1 family protein
MSRRMIWPLLFGILGCAILVGLGSWQVQRMFWKQGIIAAMDARLSEAPVPVPDPVDPQEHRYLAVTATGTILDEEIAVMASRPQLGAGYRIIAVFETDDGRRLLLDRGFLPAAARAGRRPPVQATIIGNLNWPEDADSFTPQPDRSDRLWFARDVPTMAAELDAEPVLIVLRETSEPRPPAQPVPLDTSAIPDNHRNYAITWYLLALVWAGMTAFLLQRIRQDEA